MWPGRYNLTSHLASSAAARVMEQHSVISVTSTRQTWHMARDTQGSTDTLTIQILQTIGAVFVICSGTLRHSDLTVFYVSVDPSVIPGWPHPPRVMHNIVITQEC